MVGVAKAPILVREVEGDIRLERECMHEHIVGASTLFEQLFDADISSLAPFMQVFHEVDRAARETNTT